MSSNEPAPPNLFQEAADAWEPPTRPAEVQPSTETAPAATTPSPAAAPPDPALPERLGPYRLMREIARGGMGVVYYAIHEKLNVPFAVKVLRGGVDAPAEAVERFHREAQAVARLGPHEHIVRVHDLGIERGCAYYAMDVVEGKPLSEILKRRRLDWKDTALVVMQVADALQFCHERGVIHRDLKPANILVTEDLGVLVTDFGLARDLVARSTPDTKRHVALGTIHYMSPEQARGDSRDADARSDIWSMGAVLYEMLAGIAPPRGRTLSEVRASVDDVLLPPSRILRDVPHDLELICMRCLDPDPSRRYQFADDVANDLTAFTYGAVPSVRRIGRFRRWLRWCSFRWRRGAILLAILAAAFAAGYLLRGRVEAGGAASAHGAAPAK